MQLVVALVSAVLCLWPASTTAFRALGVFPFNSHSHNIFFKALLESLAERGHQVTMVSPFPRKTPKANYTDVDLSKLFPSLVNTLTFDQMTDPNSYGTVAGMVNLVEEYAGSGLCRTFFQSQQFRDVMGGKYGQFDVVFTEIFGSECFTAVAHKLKVPLISVVTNPDAAWMHDRVGSVDNPSYHGNVYGNYLGRMNFFQRVHNVYWWIVSNYLHKRVLMDGSDAVVREFLGADTPPLSEIVKNTSLILVNRHVSLHAALPTPPNVVHVGGLHLRGATKQSMSQLDPGLRRWLDDADEHGVILFSLGSLVPSSTLPQHVQRDLLLAFGGLPQRVLWKFEVDVPDLPANVRIAKWLPQSEILAHPKLVLFMTHGGLMGTMEAVSAGVPMLGVPLFADQTTNIALYQSLGIAEVLPHWDLNRESVTNKIKGMTQDGRYLRRAREVAALYRDRPRSAEEEAVWWVEYVVRYRGAPHLRPLGADLPWYEYLLLDVAVAALAALLLALLLLRATVRSACSVLTPKRTKQD